MNAAARLPFESVHRVSTGWRWTIVLLVPPLVALMGWAVLGILQSLLSGETDIQWWIGVVALALSSALALVLIAAVIWAFRARVTIAGDEMTVRGAFSSKSITEKRMNGFRCTNGQIHIYLRDRAWAVTIGGFVNQWLIYRWIEQRTADLTAELKNSEDEAIRRDLELGVGYAVKTETLARLRKTVRRANWLIYSAAVIGFVNFLFLELREVELATVGALVLVPVFFDWFAFSNRGHVQVDQDEGSRYPQIFTGTLVAGGALALMSLLDRGALVEPGFYEIVGLAVLAKGFIWYSIDPGRIKVLRERGALALSISIAALFVMPAFWVGGSVYQLNKLLDSSPVTWHATEIVSKKVSSGRTTSYTVSVAAWDEAIEDPLEITLRRDEFNALDRGQRVEVGVREGAFGIGWVAALTADRQTP